MKTSMLRRLFHYDAELGLLFWKRTRSNRVRPGDPVGSPKGNGYLQVMLNGRNHLVHRLIWQIVTGVPPSEHIDHRNGNTTDDRFSNLRDVEQRVNVENLRRARSNNLSGLRGVTTDRARGDFVSRIRVRGATVHLGRFADPEPAHLVYLIAKRQLHEGNTL